MCSKFIRNPKISIKHTFVDRVSGPVCHCSREDETADRLVSNDVAIGYLLVVSILFCLSFEGRLFGQIFLFCTRRVLFIFDDCWLRRRWRWRWRGRGRYLVIIVINIFNFFFAQIFIFNFDLDCRRRLNDE